MLNYSSTTKVDSVNLDLLIERLKVLSEPKRLLIFNLLMEGVYCNCELSEVLELSHNLISHHLRKLRAVGLINAERDVSDSRWIYYSINRAALEELNEAFGHFFDPNRIKLRCPNCGPQHTMCLPES